MNTIKNLHLLEPLFEQGTLDKLDLGAKYYHRMSRVSFKVLEVTPPNHIITVRTSQDKSPAGVYLDSEGLISRTKDLFSILTGWNIHVRAIPFEHPPVEVVNPQWINHCMLQHSITLKQLVKDTGIDKASLSAVISGLKPLSQSMKSFFYYYFNPKDYSIKPSSVRTEAKRYKIAGVNRKQREAGL